jgi:osmotically-inducible protein OsmY
MRVKTSTVEFVMQSLGTFIRRWKMGVTVAAVAAMAACSHNDQREAERKAKDAAKQAGDAVEKAKDKAGEAADQASQAAKDIAAKVGPQAKDVALKGASAAAAVGSQAAVVAGHALETASIRAAGALRTGAIRAALLRDSSLDVSHVDVDTNETAKRVVLTGHVKSRTDRDAVDRIAHDKAPGYTIENRLVVKA